MFESIAYAAPAAGPAADQPNPLISFLPFVIILVMFYFLMIVPQQKRQKEVQKTLEALKKGDRVVTIGGIIGTIMSVHNDYVVLKLGDNENTKLEVLKTAVSGLRNQ